MAKSAVDNVWYLDQTQPQTVFLIARELRMVFRVKKVSKNNNKKRLCDRDLMWSTKSQMFTIWSFTENIC